MRALTDDQLKIVMHAAGGLPVDKRTVFLERVAAQVELRGTRLTNDDLDMTIQAALRGLVHTAAVRP